MPITQMNGYNNVVFAYVDMKIAYNSEANGLHIMFNGYNNVMFAYVDMKIAYNSEANGQHYVKCL